METAYRSNRAWWDVRWLYCLNQYNNYRQEMAKP